jgi:hypothetical protein
MPNITTPHAWILAPAGDQYPSEKGTVGFSRKTVLTYSVTSNGAHASAIAQKMRSPRTLMTG